MLSHQIERILLVLADLNHNINELADARTLWVHIEAYLPHQPGHVGCMAPRRKPHLCSEALNSRG